MSLVLIRFVKKGEDGSKSLLIDLNDVGEITLKEDGTTYGDVVNKILTEPKLILFHELSPADQDNLRRLLWGSFCVVRGTAEIHHLSGCELFGVNQHASNYISDVRFAPTIQFVEGQIPTQALDLINEASKAGRFRIRTILVSPRSDYDYMLTPHVNGKQTVTLEIVHKDSAQTVPFCFDITDNRDRTLLLQLSGRVINKKKYVELLRRIDYRPQLDACCLLLAKRYNRYRPKSRKLRGATLTRYATRLANEITNDRLKNVPAKDWFWCGPADNMRRVAITSSKVHVTCIF